MKPVIPVFGSWYFGISKKLQMMNCCLFVSYSYYISVHDINDAIYIIFSFILYLRIIPTRRKEIVAILEKYNSTSEVESVRKENISYFYKTLEVAQPKRI